MSRTVVDILKSIPPPEFKALVEVTVRQRRDLPIEIQRKLNEAIDAAIAIDGFRKPHAAPIQKVVPLVASACTDQFHLRLAVAVTAAWMGLHVEETEQALRLVEAVGIQQEPRALTKPVGEWEPGVVEQLVADLCANGTALTQREATLLVCAVGGRYADLSVLGSLPPPTPIRATPDDKLAPLWRRTIDEARNLGCDAAEWATLDEFVAALEVMRGERMRESEIAAKAAAADSALADALGALDAVPASVAAFFEVEGAIAGWKASATPWRAKGDAACAIRRLATILADAEPLTRPPSNMAERRRQAAPLEAAERAVREAVDAIAAFRKEAGESTSIDPSPAAVPVEREPEAAAPSASLAPVAKPEANDPSEVAPEDPQQEELPPDQTSAQAEAASAALQKPCEQPPIQVVEKHLDAVAEQVLSKAEPEPAPNSEAGPDGSATAYRALPPLAPELPAHLRSYSEFAASSWISPNGRCEQVPWRNAEFVDELREGAGAAMVPLRLAELAIFAQALGELGAVPRSAAPAVRALSELLAAPNSPTSGSYPDRSSSLREVLPDGGPWRRMELFLEAVRPSRETPITLERARELVDAAAFGDSALRNALLALFRLGSMGLDPVPRMKAALASDAAAAAHSPARLDELRAEFHREVVAHWNAAGAKLPRKHCRDAWTRFIEQAEPTLRALFPVSKGGRAQWDPVEMRRSIGALVRMHEEIADAAGARWDDRSKMDRAARRIADLAMGVNEAAESLQRQGHGNGHDAIPVEALRKLTARPLETPDEELCRLALVALMRGEPIESASGLSLRLLLDRPDLLSAVDGVTLEQNSPLDAVVASLDEVSDPVRAAAILLSPAEPPTAEGLPPARQLLRLLAVPNRRWLLSRLGPNAGAMVPKTARLDDEVALFEEIDALKKTWSLLDELASRSREQVRGVLQEAQALAAQPAREFDPVLCQAWLREVRAFADHSKTELLEYLSSRARAEQKGTVEQALAEGRLGDAMHLLLEGSRESTTELALRETAWRREARSRYANPLAAISAEPGELCETWRRGVTGVVVGPDRQLRTKFVEQVIEGAEKRWNQAKEHVIPTIELRKLLKPYNPTYLPQLGRFSNLCVLVAPTNPKQPNFEHATAGVVDKLGKENLYAVLAPLVSEAGRQAALKEFRRRGLAAAIIDDLDLCRILNLGGRRPSGLVALLEVILEQQAWSTHFTPFAMHDGQHVQMEMYVGRRVEAEQLTQTPAFSRLFSGRKLGKSALLRYVHDTRDGLKLPSGNTLRVLFVPAVGAESDLDVVDRFAEQLAERLGFKVDGLKLEGNPGDALVQLAKRFVDERPAESLLVVFDEADKFVEAQLEAYDREREACLSFRMRTQLESFRDAAMLPRIRFVFAGYRATSTAEGAWANWGDVLRLKPLTLDEGARLIAGPLARMGIDASAQATTIAHRCGCQPVVLLRFGELLLKHLEGRYGPSQRDHVVVTAADVAAVFNEEPVREEIRVVVRNNFQDSPRARVVFSALLGEFAQHAPGDGLAEADQLVTERLRAIDRDLAWLHAAPEAQVLEVQRFLKDFAARELVLIRRGPDGQPACHLRFPHHLAILLPEDPEGAIRADIAALRRRGAGVAAEAPRALVTPRVLDLLRDAACRPPDRHVRIEAAVVGSHWPAAVAHRSGGFADRLGIPPDACHTPTKADRGLGRERVAVMGAPPDAIQRIAAKRAREKPAPLFLGGADALRWAYTRQLESDEMFEIVGLGRLGGPTLDWWFGKVRALGFEQLDWRDRIQHATSGIPLLLAELERHLLGTSDGGIEIGRDKLEAAISATTEAEPRLAAALAGADAAIALSPREREILRMLAHVGVTTEYRSQRPSEDLTELWDDLYRPSLNVPAVDPTSRGDRVSVAVLVALGLAPTGGADIDEDPLRRLSVPPKDDRMYRLARAMLP
ncbi:hypothetical protein [Anaeromyxobacter dehalogenans]|uniref:Uncharacterized protein n=1 Tax=Anaeromyxobacter dehalogenans (strain 2CP-C) TaxID=290397 RepID=Q2IEK2_ANADE|nr:hypothetical protein [Anaeromyxobacter dehalogenans]ABC83014.1 hypothetical protein Adeh_3246 [Anaeromyxobacter dehalogenans 2CP-C]